MNYVSDINKFNEMLDNPGKEFKSEEKENIISVKKNLVIGYPSDSTGCGHIRLVFPFAYLNSIFGKTGQLHPILMPFFCFQSNILMRTRSIIFQRQMTAEHVAVIKKYKEAQEQLKIKLVYDTDDDIYGKNELQGGNKFEGVPSYNFGHEHITDQTVKNSIDAMNTVDLVTTSSEYLKQILIKYGVKTPITVIPNTVPLFFYGTKRKQPIKDKITKPKVIYTGSPTHWSEQRKMKGDFDNSWCEWILKNVKDNKIDFLMMGGKQPPFFFKELEGLPNFHPIGWLNSFQYHLPIMDFAANFSIGPLVPNEFNKSKSNIKAIESYASGSAFIGTTFTDGFPSPYDDNMIKCKDNCSVEDIDKIFDRYTEPDFYNEVIKSQYEYMVKNNRYLESPGFIRLLTSIL